MAGSFLRRVRKTSSSVPLSFWCLISISVLMIMLCQKIKLVSLAFACSYITCFWRTRFCDQKEVVLLYTRLMLNKKIEGLFYYAHTEIILLDSLVKVTYHLNKWFITYNSKGSFQSFAFYLYLLRWPKTLHPWHTSLTIYVYNYTIIEMTE